MHLVMILTFRAPQCNVVPVMWSVQSNSVSLAMRLVMVNLRGLSLQRPKRFGPMGTRVLSQLLFLQ